MNRFGNTGARQLTSDCAQLSKIGADQRSKSYTVTAKLLHWVIAGVIIFNASLGWSLGDRVGMDLAIGLGLHAQAGVLMLALVVLRLLWRIAHPPPVLPSSITVLEQLLSQFTHYLMYLFMMLVPITGVLTAVSHEVPVWVTDNNDLRDLATYLGHGSFEFRRLIHANAVNILLSLTLLHVGAALWHQFWRRDGLIGRIIPTIRSGNIRKRQ